MNASTPSPARLAPYLPLVIALALAAGTEAFVSTAVGIALPRIAADLSASPDEISWAVTLYLTGYAVALPLTAWLSDRFGQRPYLGFSILAYAAASLGCLASTSLTSFLVWRTLEGAAGSAFLARAIFTFTKELRPPVLTRALMIFIGGFSLRAFGLPFGGLLIDSYSWRWIFAAAALLLIGGALPALLQSAEIWPRRPAAPSPDTAEIVLLGVGLGALLVALARGERDEWLASPTIAGLVLVGATALAGFVWRQIRGRGGRHVLPLSVLHYGGMAVGVVLSFLAGAMLIGGVYVLPQFFLGIVHTDAYRAGWLMSLDGWALMAGLASAANLLGRRMTRAPLMLSGLTFAFSMLWLARCVTSATPIEALYGPVLLHGYAVGLALPPIGIFSFRAIGANHADNSEGRAWHYTARQVGAAVAVALAVVVLDVRTTAHSGRLAEHFTTLNPAATQAVAAIGRALVSHGLAPAAAGPAAHLVADHMVMREATVLAFRDFFVLAAAVGLAVSALTFGLPGVPRRRPAPAASTPALPAPFSPS